MLLLVNPACKETSVVDESAPDELAEIQQTVEELIIQQEVPSMAIGVARDGETIWSETFGWADIEEEMEATPQTMYSTASISKPFTAAGIMLLAEQGKIDLEDPANNYLEDAPLTGYHTSSDSVTIRKLLNHTAGLPLHYQFFYEDDDYERPPMSESIRRYGIVVYEPGEHYQYANFGYGVLDEIISRVSGQSYAEFMREELFIPLGLSRTYIGIDIDEFDNHAIRYNPEFTPLPNYDFDHRGASAVYSTVDDLLKFGNYFTQKSLDDSESLLSKDARQKMKEPSSNHSSTEKYGLGWISREHDSGLREVWHTGSMGGVSTILTLVPEENIVVTVLANGRHPATSMIARSILHKLEPDKIDSPGAGQSESEEQQPPADYLAGRWTGNVITHSDTLEVSFYFHDTGDVEVVLDNQSPVMLEYARYNDGTLSGIIDSEIKTDDASRRPHILQLDAVTSENRIRGALTAISLPGERVGNALSSYIELTKE